MIDNNYDPERIGIEVNILFNIYLKNNKITIFFFFFYSVPKNIVLTGILFMLVQREKKANSY